MSGTRVHFLAGMEAKGGLGSCLQKHDPPGLPPGLSGAVGWCPVSLGTTAILKYFQPELELGLEAGQSSPESLLSLLY